MITITFEAETVEALREQMASLWLGQGAKHPVEQIDSKPKKQKAKAPEPQPEPEVEPEAEAEAVTDIEEAEAETMEETVTPEAEKAVALLKLKEQQLSRLRDLFNAGKGPLVRQLLAKYGEGAKVFPEVDPKHFPAIKVELDRELGAH